MDSALSFGQTDSTLSTKEIPMRDVVLYGMDTMADWEYPYVLAGVAMAGAQGPPRFQTRVMTGDGEPVTSMGGMRVIPDGDLDGVDPTRTAVLVLPGGTTWEAGHDAALDLARRVLDAGGTVAAICGATLGLARAGLLDDRAHTSNAPDFLAPSGYAGADRYVDQRTVADGGVITAPGTMPVDFAAAVFRAIELFPDEVIDAWYGLYTSGERRYFEQLTATG